MAEKRYTCNCNGKTRKCYHPCSRGCCPNGKDIGSSRGTLNEIQTNNQLNSLNDRDFSILGGVVAPKRSAYVIQGMRNPLTEKQNGALDTTRPSVRDNSSVSRFNDFNPYNNAPKRSPEIIRNEMYSRTKIGDVKYTMNVNTFQPTGSPVLKSKFRR
tara:strand:+ start:2346 stop:2816 length:471 start_codon:yes stop_codon:yes gene_type:complete